MLHNSYTASFTFEPSIEPTVLWKKSKPTLFIFKGSEYILAPISESRVIKYLPLRVMFCVAPCHVCTTRHVLLRAQDHIWKWGYGCFRFCSDIPGLYFIEKGQTEPLSIQPCVHQTRNLGCYMSVCIHVECLWRFQSALNFKGALNFFIHKEFNSFTPL